MTTIKHRCVVAWAIAICCFAPAKAAQPTAPSPASAPASPVSIAIIEPEVLAGIPADQRTTTSSAASAPLTEILGELAKTMEGTHGVTVLDRDHIRKLLEEHKLSLTGLIQQPVKLGGMLGAKYLLCVQTTHDASARTLAVICIEVSSGNVIWERASAQNALGDLKAIAQWASDTTHGVLAATAANEARRDRPTATVLAISNRSQSRRMDFLEGSLCGLTEDLLESQSYRVLRRLNPGLLAKETTLGASGMVRPDAAVLAEAADLVVTASFVESPSDKLAFEQTPVKLTLGLKPRGQANREIAVNFTLETLNRLRTDLGTALTNRTPATSTASAPADDHIARRLEAAKLMGELERLPYDASLETHRHQIEVAQRAIYLDPEAKEAYYYLGYSLDSLTRRTWSHGGTREGSSQDTVDALLKYLGFPRTSKEHVSTAFRVLMSHVGVVNKNDPEKCIPFMAENVRWEHELDPVKPPRRIGVDFYYDDWWERNPQKRVEFYLWVDKLYEKKQHLSVLPFKLAKAYDGLKQYDKAAEYYYDGFVSHKLSQLELNSVTYGGDPQFYNSRNRARELAKYLDSKRADELLARVGRSQPATGNSLAAMYGDAYGNAKDVYAYAYRSDGDRLRNLHISLAAPEAVPLGQTLVQSVILRRTRAGLWMQGGTQEGGFALFFSADGRTWKAVAAPEQMTKITQAEAGMAESANHVVSIVQLGDEVLFGTCAAGLFVCDLRKSTWRSYGLKEGLPAKFISQMTASSDGESVWITGGGFLCRYQDAKIFLPKVKVELYPDGMFADGDRLLMLCDEQLIALQPDSGVRKTLASGPQQRSLVPAPAMFYGPPRGRNAGVNTWQRLNISGHNVCFAGEHGLVMLSADGRAIRLWRPDGLYYWKELAGWVLGNCPLPPCILLEVIPDDRDPSLLWLVSKKDDVLPPYQYSYAAFSKEMWGSVLDCDKETACFVTLFNTKTNRFSKPVQTKSPFTHAQPFGDYVYLTGRTFGRLPKKAWVADQPGVQDEGPPRIECPDTPVGRAARAMLLGDAGAARADLQTALDAKVAPTEVKRMLQALTAQSRPATKPGGKPASSPAP